MKTKKSEVLLTFMHFCNDIQQQFHLSNDDIKCIKKDYFKDKEFENALDDFLKYRVPYDTPNAFSVDNTPIYGGWLIHQNCSEGSGNHCPFGYNRCKSTSFVNKLHFARELNRLQRYKKEYNLKSL